MRFLLFSKISFEVSHPVALVEAYCFQGDFYSHYDLLRNRKVEDANKIGARIKKDVLSDCEDVVESQKDLPIFGCDVEEFLNLDAETRNGYIRELSQVINELLDIRGIGFSKATKILHTLYPRMIPMIDVALQKEYKGINPEWKEGEWTRLLIDYYDNFLVGNNWKHLTELSNILSKNNLALTKVRIFDVLWWSYLKAKSLQEKQNVLWTTIRRLT